MEISEHKSEQVSMINKDVRVIISDSMQNLQIDTS